MNYQVTITRQAQADIARIVKYVAAKFGTVTAREVFGFLQREIGQLANQPDKGYRIPQLERLGWTKFRLLVLPPHNKVIYEKNDRSGKITVRVVFGARQSFEKVLQERILAAQA